MRAMVVAASSGPRGEPSASAGSPLRAKQPHHERVGDLALDDPALAEQALPPTRGRARPPPPEQSTPTRGEADPPPPTTQRRRSRPSRTKPSRSPARADASLRGSTSASGRWSPISPTPQPTIAVGAPWLS